MPSRTVIAQVIADNERGSQEKSLGGDDGTPSTDAARIWYFRTCRAGARRSKTARWCAYGMPWRGIQWIRLDTFDPEIGGFANGFDAEQCANEAASGESYPCDVQCVLTHGFAGCGSDVGSLCIMRSDVNS